MSLLKAGCKTIMYIKLRGRGVFLNNRSMDNLFLKPHELVARDRKEKIGNYL
jgi:hypothetical protein